MLLFIKINVYFNVFILPQLLLKIYKMDNIIKRFQTINQGSQSEIYVDLNINNKNNFRFKLLNF
jgi:hypothetical protein